MSEKPPLHDLLKELAGVSNCYFSPPATIHMHYPCVVYHRSNRNISYADNRPYQSMDEYMVTIIDRDPDNRRIDRFFDTLPYCSFVREYAVDGLHHSIVRLFYNGPRVRKGDQNESDA